MKKFIFLLIGGFLLSNFSYGQAVDDRALIPVSVTLQSILRINIVSGGNIEFNFNTLDQYQGGINNGGGSAEYQTAFNVASSVNWNVFIYAEDATLLSTDIGGGGMDLDNVGYQVEITGTALAAELNIPSIAATQPLTALVTEVLVGHNGTLPNAGGTGEHSYLIDWRCGTTEPNMNATSLLDQQLSADRYATNVFLVLEPI